MPESSHPARLVRPSVGIRKNWKLVDVVDVEDLAPVEVAGTLVVLEVERVADRPKIGASVLIVDLVRPCVVDFEAQAVATLLTQPNLDAAVACGRDIGPLLGDAGKARKGPLTERSGRW